YFTRLLMTVPPSSSPAFPYTTLFRSQVQHCLAHLRIVEGRQRMIEAQYAHIAERIDGVDDDILVGGENREDVGGRLLVPIRLARDRKSTRLNSSHGSISYAVFCLKKK